MKLLFFRPQFVRDPDGLPAPVHIPLLASEAAAGQRDADRFGKCILQPRHHLAAEFPAKDPRQRVDDHHGVAEPETPPGYTYRHQECDDADDDRQCGRDRLIPGSLEVCQDQVFVDGPEEAHDPPPTNAPEPHEPRRILCRMNHAARAPLTIEQPRLVPVLFAPALEIGKKSGGADIGDIEETNADHDHQQTERPEEDRLSCPGFPGAPRIGHAINDQTTEERNRDEKQVDGDREHEIESLLQPVFQGSVVLTAHRSGSPCVALSQYRQCQVLEPENNLLVVHACGQSQPDAQRERSFALPPKNLLLQILGQGA